MRRDIFSGESVSDFLNVNSIYAFPAILNIIRNFVTLVDLLVNQSGDVQENFLSGLIIFNKTVAFCGIKKFDFSCVHLEVWIMILNLLN